MVGEVSFDLIDGKGREVGLHERCQGIASVAWTTNAASI